MTLDNFVTRTDPEEVRQTWSKSELSDLLVRFIVETDLVNSMHSVVDKQLIGTLDRLLTLSITRRFET